MVLAQTVIADMLIKKGADVTFRDNNGKTARDLAKNRTRGNHQRSYLFFLNHNYEHLNWNELNFSGSNEILGLLDAAEGKPKVSTD